MNNRLKKSYRRHILFLGGIVTLSLFTSGMYASNIFIESESESDFDLNQTVWSDKEDKPEESSYWDISETDGSEKRSVSFFKESISEEDDDFKLDAPPPGEIGNPQKIAPLGSFDVIALLLLSGIACILYVKRMIEADV